MSILQNIFNKLKSTFGTRKALIFVVVLLILYKFKARAVSVVQKILRILYTLPIIGSFVDQLTLLIISAVRFLSGHWVATNIEQCHRPNKLLKLYEYEGCPFCKKVRETLSVLDLDCIIYPCPRETFKSYGFIKDSRYRGQVKALGGKAQFPFLIDENNIDEKGEPLQMYESNEINKYLWKEYGNKARQTPTYWLGSTKISFILLLLSTGFLRSFPEQGLMRLPSKKPEKLLELWSFEASPFCKKVREILTSLEIAYVLRNAARGSVNRKEFRQRFGKQISNWRKSVHMIQVPLLVDSNNNIEMMLESDDIKRYLIDTYQNNQQNGPSESISDYLQSN